MKKALVSLMLVSTLLVSSVVLFAGCGGSGAGYAVPGDYRPMTTEDEKFLSAEYTKIGMAETYALTGTVSLSSKDGNGEKTYSYTYDVLYSATDTQMKMVGSVNVVTNEYGFKTNTKVYSYVVINTDTTSQAEDEVYIKIDGDYSEKDENGDYIYSNLMNDFVTKFPIKMPESVDGKAYIKSCVGSTTTIAKPDDNTKIYRTMSSLLSSELGMPVQFTYITVKDNVIDSVLARTEYSMEYGTMKATLSVNVQASSTDKKATAPSNLNEYVSLNK